MPATRISTLALTILFCICTMLRADTVILKNGDKLEGKILSETDTELTMSVQVTATIKDERVVKKEEIEKVLKIQPEEEAWTALGHLVPGNESLERDDYDRVKAALQYFITSFPQSGYAKVAKERLDQFTAEQKRVNEGEVKLDGKWLSKESVKEESIQVGGHILLNRMKRAAGAGQLTEAMAIFDQLEKGFRGSASYPDAIELGRRILPSLKPAVEQRQAQLKRRIADEKQRLSTSKGAEHDQLDALIKQEQTSTNATIAALERSGVRWLPLQPANEKSLAGLATRITPEITRLNGLNTEKMRDSVKAADQAAAALSSGNLDDAAKSLQSATASWPENERARRLQVKLTDAKKAAAPKAPTPTPTPTPKPKASKSTSDNPAPVVPVGEPEPVEKPFYKRPLFFIVVAVLVAFGAIGGKMFAKSRAGADSGFDH